MSAHFGMQMRINFFVQNQNNVYRSIQFTAGITVRTQVCINCGSI